MEKSTWNEFTKDLKKGLMFRGADWTKKSNPVKLLDTSKTVEFEANRHLVSGSSVLKMKTDKGTFSHLDKLGKVSKYKNHYIIDAGDTNIYYQYA